MKAMILAAGFGMRLRPLTEVTPKPLIEMNGKPIIIYTLEALKKAGVKDVIINLHHLGYKIKQALGNGSQFKLNIQYSDEPEIMGTAGALLLVKEYLNEPFYLINADILFDLNLKILPPILSKKNADAVMVLYKAKQNQKKLANVYMNIHGYIQSLFKPSLGTIPYVFTGIQFLKPNVLDLIPRDIKKPSTTMHMYPAMLKTNRLIAGYVHDGLWIDIGSPENLEKARNVFR